jgi:hypothetical protein
MPNWCYNSLTIEGSQELIADIKRILNRPFVREHENYNMTTNQMEVKTYNYSNPVFAFWNIIRPTNLAAYNQQDDFSKPIEERLKFIGDNWYDWNVRNWGTKWDVAVSDDDSYPETELIEEWSDRLIYSFNTAWSPPLPAIETLSKQYPSLTFNLSYEEETGWGGEVEFKDGDMTTIEDYENKCRDCDEINCMEYCENDCGEICNKCNYLGEADLEYVKECQTHNIYLDETERV